MNKYVALTIVMIFSLKAYATSTLEKNIAECTISSNAKFEEVILKQLQTQDADNNIYEDYVLDHTFGELEGVSSDILGRHEQVRYRLFTTANAEEDGVVREGARDFVMVTHFDHSSLVIKLDYVGQDQDDFPTYNMSFDGEGPAFELVVERLNTVLDESEHYDAGDDILCVSHFDLSTFVTQ